MLRTSADSIPLGLAQVFVPRFQFGAVSLGVELLRHHLGSLRNFIGLRSEALKSPLRQEAAGVDDRVIRFAGEELLERRDCRTGQFTVDRREFFPSRQRFLFRHDRRARVRLPESLIEILGIARGRRLAGLGWLLRFLFALGLDKQRRGAFDPTLSFFFVFLEF